MAYLTVTVCDKCGSEEASRIVLAVGASRYTVDLCDDCQQEILDAIIAMAPEAIASGKSSSSATSKEIRAWAHENNIDVPLRGRISKELRAMYDDSVSRASVVENAVEDNPNLVDAEDVDFDE